MRAHACYLHYRCAHTRKRSELKRFLVFLKALWLSSNKKEEKTRRLSDRQQCLRMLHRLSLYSHLSYDPKKALYVAIEAPNDDILTFTESLEKFNDILANQMMLSPSLCYVSTKRKSLDDYFVSKNNHYIPTDVITRFIRAATLLCEQTETSEEATFGDLEHNYRMLTSVYTSIKSICSALLEAYQ